MNIWNKILLGLIFVASVAFFYLAMRTLKTHQHWRETADAFEVAIGDLKEENQDLLEADPVEDDRDEMGIKRLRLELTKLLTGRGRVWYHCNPEKADPQTGQTAVTIENPSPHGIAAGSVLYVVEEADLDQGGRYLGQFEVAGVDEGQVSVEPATAFTSEQLERVAQSQGPWSLYEIMPKDFRSVFAGLDEAELRELLPEETVEQFVYDGQEMTEQRRQELGLPGSIEDGRYVRPLRDYALLFKNRRLQQSELIDLIASTTRDKDYMLAAADDAKLQRQFRQQEKSRLEGDKRERERWYDAAVRHRDTLRERVQGYREAAQQWMAKNKSLAGQIARIQLAAKERIDARTRQEMARLRAERAPKAGP